MDNGDSDEKPFYPPGHAARTFKDREASPGELLFEFVTAGHVRWRCCELRDLGDWGIDLQWFRDEEFSRSQRFDRSMDATRTPRELAIAWAEEERKAIESV
jgi:hypothetical protein